MKDLYTQTSIECSALITKRYSTSFSLGIRLLGKEIRNDIFSIYGFVRLADEIVDTYQDKNPVEELRLLKEETFRAIQNGISFNPVLHAFQDTVNTFKISHDYIDAFLYSMELDLTDQTYDQELYEKYIYGSAEVVGLMCLKVFCQNNDALFYELVEPARKLGSAFQKVNFLRDIRSDLIDRKRVYFPGLDIDRFSDLDKRKIEKEIEDEFKEAQKGILRLPSNSRNGVQLALNYYRGLLHKIVKSQPSELLTKRIRITNFHKLVLLLQNLIRFNSYTYHHA
jgi:phytoene/squalene synthetase